MVRRLCALPACLKAFSPRCGFGSACGVKLTQQKNGVPASACCRVMKSLAAAAKSSSQVSIPFPCQRAGILDGSASPTLPQRGCSVGSSLSVAKQCNITAWFSNLSLNLGSFG